MTIRELSENITNENFKEIFNIINSKYDSKGVKDSITEVNFSLDDLKSIRDLQYEEVKCNFIRDGYDYMTLDQARDYAVTKFTKDIKGTFEKIQDRFYTKDGFYNPVSGFGTISDPGMYNKSYVPVSMSPDEATSYYASRGLGSLIIDKKSKIPFLNGYQFVDGLSPDDLQILTEHSLKKGFDRVLISSLRDSLIYGGGGIIPKFNNDDFETYSMSLEELQKAGILDQNSINHFISSDRWNMVVVPDYNITAKNYLFPDFVYLPLGSMKMNVERISLIRPYPLPYWAAIRQLGWSTSDFEGYIRQIMGYNIIISAIPIMAQQMSLLIHEFPMEGIIAENGPEWAKSFVKENENRLREWSMVNPKALNSFGKISVIERSYSGFRELIETYREDIGANATIPVSNMFMLQAKGMSSDNEQDTTLKQSESIKMIESELKHQLKPIIKILVIDCFGANSEQAKKADNVNIDFNSPIVISNKEKSEMGIAFGQFVSSMVASQMPLDMVVKQSKQFFPDYEIDEEDLERLGTPSELEEPSDLFGGLNKEPEKKKGLFDSIFGKRRFTKDGGEGSGIKGHTTEEESNLKKEKLNQSFEIVGEKLNTPFNDYLKNVAFNFYPQISRKFMSEKDALKFIDNIKNNDKETYNEILKEWKYVDKEKLPDSDIVRNLSDQVIGSFDNKKEIDYNSIKEKFNTGFKDWYEFDKRNVDIDDFKKAFKKSLLTKINKESRKIKNPNEKNKYDSLKENIDNISNNIFNDLEKKGN
jgi:hypothetical protein